MREYFGNARVVTCFIDPDERRNHRSAGGSVQTRHFSTHPSPGSKLTLTLDIQAGTGLRRSCHVPGADDCR